MYVYSCILHNPIETSTPGCNIWQLPYAYRRGFSEKWSSNWKVLRPCSFLCFSFSFFLFCSRFMYTSEYLIDTFCTMPTFILTYVLYVPRCFKGKKISSFCASRSKISFLINEQEFSIYNAFVKYELLKTYFKVILQYDRNCKF